MQKKDISPTISRTVVEPVAFDPSTASAEFVISTDAKDRDGDILIPDGCLPLLHTYRANPIVLFDHGQLDPLPIGLSEVPDTNACTVTIHQNKITARAYFHCDTLMSAQCCRLVDKKILRAASIGFRGIKADQVEPGRKSTGHIFTEWEMLEWSVVAVPANQEALRIALSAKWEGKALAEPLQRRFKSLLLPSKKLIFPARVQFTSKRMKAMPDETVEQTADETTETAQLPTGAQGINILLEGLKQTVDAVKEIVPAIEHPGVLKLLDKFLSKADAITGEIRTGATSIYPDIFSGEETETEADEETETEVEETTEETEETEETEVTEDKADTEEEEKQDDEDVSSAEKSMKFKKNFQKECVPHQQSITDAAELVDEMSKSDNIPSGYKRQCKGVLPGLKSASKFLSDKSGDVPEDKTEDIEEEKTEVADEEKEVTEEEEKAALAELKKLSTKITSNAKELSRLKGVK